MAIKRRYSSLLVPDLKAERDPVLSVSVRLVPLMLDLQTLQRSTVVCRSTHCDHQRSQRDHQQLHDVTFTCKQAKRKQVKVVYV